MKKILFFRTVFLMISLLFVILNFNCYALDSTTSLLTGAEGWSYTEAGVVNSTKHVMATAINVIRIVGTGIAIIMITYVAIKYMSAAPSEKAEFKKSATAMIVGAIVLFASTNILSVISKFATSNIKS